MMVEQCNSGLFNAQSTANAWYGEAPALHHGLEQRQALLCILQHSLHPCIDCTHVPNRFSYPPSDDLLPPRAQVGRRQAARGGAAGERGDGGRAGERAGGLPHLPCRLGQAQRAGRQLHLVGGGKRMGVQEDRKKAGGVCRSVADDLAGCHPAATLLHVCSSPAQSAVPGLPRPPHPTPPATPPSCRYSLGRLASDGYAPSPLALQLLWDRTHKLTLNFDSQGIANVLW